METILANSSTQILSEKQLAEQEKSENKQKSR